MNVVAKKIGSTLSYDVTALREFLAKRKDGEEFLVVIEPLSEVKSKDALGYYWKAMVAHLVKNVEQFGGWNKHDVHKWLKAECAFGVDVSEMDKKEFSEYIDRCRLRLSEEGVYIQTPEEYYKSIGSKK